MTATTNANCTAQSLTHLVQTVLTATTEWTALTSVQAIVQTTSATETPGTAPMAVNLGMKRHRTARTVSALGFPCGLTTLVILAVLTCSFARFNIIHKY